MPYVEYVCSMDETSLDQVLSTELRVLSLFLDDLDRENYLEELAKRSGISKTTIKRSLDKLVESGLLKYRNDGYRTHYIVEKGHFMNHLKIIKNLDSPVIWRSLERFKQGSLILYGSRANGTNDDKSDWDLLLIGDDIDAREVNSEVQRIEKETGASVNVMISTRKDIESIRERRNTFYLELLRSHHILRGDFGEL